MRNYWIIAWLILFLNDQYVSLFLNRDRRERVEKYCWSNVLYNVRSFFQKCSFVMNFRSLMIAIWFVFSIVSLDFSMNSLSNAHCLVLLSRSRFLNLIRFACRAIYNSRIENNQRYEKNCVVTTSSFYWMNELKMQCHSISTWFTKTRICTI